MCFNTKRIVSFLLIFTLLFSSSVCSAKSKTMYTKKPIKMKGKVVPQYYKVNVKLVKIKKAELKKTSAAMEGVQQPVDKPVDEGFLPNIIILKPHDYFTWILPKKTEVKIGRHKGKISTKDLTKKKPKAVVKKIPYNTFKSYMSYRAITSTGSPQYKLQRKAYTDGDTGVRMVDGRYCIAVGPKVATKIGTKLDLMYKNGKIVPAIVADQKSGTVDGYRHGDGSAVEFVVDNSALPRCAKRAGDMSALDEFKGRITKAKVYKK